MTFRPGSASRLDWPMALAMTAIAGLGVALARDHASIWSAWRSASCLPDACFCEAVRDRLVRQPANTISSLLFLAPGFVILRRSAGDPNGVSARLYGFALLLVGLGSGFYHASLTFAGQTADILGMYLLATFAVLAVAARRFGWSQRALAGSYVLGNAALLAVQITVPAVRRYLFAGLILTTVVLELRGPRPAGRRLLAGAIGCLAVGFAVWSLDLTGTVCAPTHWLQGHAIWHGLGAASATLFYAYTVRAASRPVA